MRLDSVVAYTYRADTYCGDCVLIMLNQGDYGLPAWTTEEALDDIAERVGLDRYDERSYDSDDFPKVVFADSIGDAGPEYCGRCHARLDD